MNKIGPQPAKNAPVDGNSPVDIEAIIEQIWGDLRGATSRSDIRKALMEAAPKYEDARIKTYVPIFLRKEVLRRLQGESAHFQGAKSFEPENAASGKVDDSAREDTPESGTKYARPELEPARTS